MEPGGAPKLTLRVAKIQQPPEDDEYGADKPEGFWLELFLLRPERASLRRLLDGLSAGELLQLEEQTRQLFARAVGALKGTTGGAQQEVAEGHALELRHHRRAGGAGPRRHDLLGICGFSGWDNTEWEELGTTAKGRRDGPGGHVWRVPDESVDVLYTEGYVSRHHEGERSLQDMVWHGGPDTDKGSAQFIQETDTPIRVFQPFTLLGLLANYNKFEFQNPYQLRLNDFVNEATIQTVVRSVGYTCQRLRAQYVDIQEDLPEGWTLASTLNMIGLGAIAPGPRPEKKVVYDAETAKQMFTKLPGEEAALLLATYDFSHANKLFCFNLMTLKADKGEEQPFASYLSLTSYLLQHAHLSQRATVYCHLNLMVFRLLIEDPVLCKRMCSDEGKAAVRLCRQRQPHLPAVRTERVLAASLLDTMIDGINHNLRRRLDVGLYALCVGILLRAVSYMSRSRTRLQYHWAELFRSLLGLVRFLTTYAADLRDLPHVETLLDHVVNLLALGLSAGEAFLPTPAAYDDLFYKVVEAGDVLVKFRDTYGLADRPSNSIHTLVSVSAHYKQMLAEGTAKGGKGGRVVGKGGTLTSLQVAEVIKQGYETLSIQAKEGLDSWERYREADERTVLKRMARTAVGDVKVLIG
ncbi:uncharacterized protein E0L32_006014 [Thyridium curvatum]|uniref:Armadillo-like helical domain-containing protein n=1 Tax=Thyridium curvatum TaxID=1093900 RepID=A0A507B0X3_9PEZI|nr:uncharacterized protein E0L32_006014 [Thyridium curvatum]TPX13543.1 hypothetical protein E0L32_006014 [Thyridium curvatum]